MSELEKAVDKKELATTSGKQYLDKDFSVELNYKLWTTKGARFVASNRLKNISRLSSYAIGFLTAYIIIINMLSVFNIQSIAFLTPQVLAFTTTGLSIIILVFSQLENASEYRLRAENHHACAIEVGELYNELRHIKTSIEDLKTVNQESKTLAHRYSNILKQYENHEPIDFEYFKTTKRDYFGLSNVTILKTKLKYYYTTRFLYHSLIILPPVLLSLGVIFSH